MTRRFLPSALALATVLLAGCTNTQDENERLARIINQQKATLGQLDETNEFLKRKNQDLEIQLQAAMAKVSASGEEKKLDEEYQKMMEGLVDSLRKQTGPESKPEDEDFTWRQGVESDALLISEKVLFHSGVAEISPKGKTVLDKVAEVLKKSEGKVIRVDGHSDNDPINRTKEKYTSNWHLSGLRATRVIEYLTEKCGLKPDQMYLAGFAFYKPLKPNNSAANKAGNRRVEITIFKKS